MNQRAIFSLKKACLSLCVGVGAFSISLAAQAATTGYDPKVMDALKAKAQAEVAYDVALQGLITKPNSVLALTCFNKAASVAAKEAGAIFSGDFSDDLSHVISDSLVAFYDDFAGALGSGSGEPLEQIYAQTALDATDYDCDAMSKLWDFVKDKGVDAGIPAATMDDLRGLTTTISSGTNVNPNFQTEWNASGGNGQNIFQALDTALNDLDLPPQIPTGLNNANNTCQVLVSVGVLPNTTTCPP